MPTALRHPIPPSFSRAALADLHDTCDLTLVLRLNTGTLYTEAMASNMYLTPEAESQRLEIARARHGRPQEITVIRAALKSLRGQDLLGEIMDGSAGSEAERAALLDLRDLVREALEDAIHA